jgi:putative hydrolase of the HAD superfamily
MKPSICAVFDIDDTLYLERDYVHSGFEAVGHWAAKWLRINDFAERSWNRFISGKRRSIFDEVLCESGRKANPELVSALVEIYRTHTPSIALAPDASEALEAISRIASIAVISDGPAASQSRKAEALGISSFAALIVLTEMFGTDFRKPQSRAFELVSQCSPAGVYAYIADNPLKDFTAPRQLGWITVRVRRRGGLYYAVEHPEITADREMHDCSGLCELFERL